ncbi:hypothetical protein E3E31_12115, partial [Thermococcus sp. M39]|uniref:hypothetical protein n=1 Tax=Thermococcus sp. M39 TaxID=1638262 RepID=UPI001439A8FD
MNNNRQQFWRDYLFNIFFIATRNDDARIEVTGIKDKDGKTITIPRQVPAKALLNDKEFKKHIGALIEYLNEKQEADVYFAIAPHSFEKLKEKAKAEGKDPERIRGNDSTTIDTITIIPVDIDFKKIDNIEVHRQKVIPSLERVKEAAEVTKNIILDIFNEIGIEPTSIFFTGGGVQAVFITKEEAITTEELAKAEQLIANILEKELKKKTPEWLELEIDKIANPSHLIRLPLTKNYKYRLPDGQKVILQGEILHEGEPIDLRELIQKLEEYAKKNNINITQTKEVKKKQILAKRPLKIIYDVRGVQKEELEKVLVDMFVEIFKTATKMQGLHSRQFLTLAIAAYLHKYTNINAETLIEIYQNRIFPAL